MNKLILPLMSLLAFTAIGGCIALSAFWLVDHNTLTSERDRLQAALIKERGYKQDLQEILDKNLNANGELIQSATDFVNGVEQYNESVTKSFRVIDDKTELLPEANGKLILSNQEQVTIDRQNLEYKINQVIKEKESANNRISEIFSESDQNLQNRADPRDGTRNP